MQMLMSNVSASDETITFSAEYIPFAISVKSTLHPINSISMLALHKIISCGTAKRKENGIFL